DLALLARGGEGFIPRLLPIRRLRENVRREQKGKKYNQNVFHHSSETVFHADSNPTCLRSICRLALFLVSSFNFFQTFWLRHHQRRDLIHGHDATHAREDPLQEEFVVVTTRRIATVTHDDDAVVEIARGEDGAG